MYDIMYCLLYTVQYTLKRIACIETHEKETCPQPLGGVGVESAMWRECELLLHAMGALEQHMHNLHGGGGGIVAKPTLLVFDR